MSLLSDLCPQGEIKHVVQVILNTGGMFTADQRVKPAILFNEFVESVKWPSSIGRLPQKVRFFVFRVSMLIILGTRCGEYQSRSVEIIALNPPRRPVRRMAKKRFDPR